MRANFSKTVILVVSMFAHGAHATLLGHDVLIQGIFPNISSVFASQIVTAGPDAEATALGNRSEIIDLRSSSIVVSNTRGSSNNVASFNGYRFFDLDNAVTQFADVFIAEVSGYSPAANIVVEFDSDNIYLNVQGTRFSADAFVEVGIRFGGQIPEPMSASLLALGVFVLRSRTFRNDR